MVQKIKTWVKKAQIAPKKYPKLTNGVAVLIGIGLILLYPLGKALGIFKKKKK